MSSAMEIKRDFLNVLNKAKQFGMKETESGTVMLGHVPHVAPQAWFHILFSKLYRSHIELIEFSLKSTVPNCLRNLLYINNGMNIFSNNLSFYGYRVSINRSGDISTPFDIIELNQYYKPRDASGNEFFFASYRYDSSLVYINQQDKSIHRCAKGSVKPLNSWNNLSDFINIETNRLNGLFIEGKLINANCIITP